MKAIELKRKWLKENMINKVGVIAIGKDYWYHVHNDEEIPQGLTIALHPRGLE